jgi:hypothetical protein
MIKPRLMQKTVAAKGESNVLVLVPRVKSVFAVAAVYDRRI